jgi:hypothetical protein
VLKAVLDALQTPADTIRDSLRAGTLDYLIRAIPTLFISRFIDETTVVLLHVIIAVMISRNRQASRDLYHACLNMKIPSTFLAITSCPRTRYTFQQVLRGIHHHPRESRYRRFEDLIRRTSIDLRAK